MKPITDRIENIQPLRESIIGFMKNHGQDEEKFLEELEQIAASEGDLIFPVLLNVFTQLDFSREEAKEIWEGIIRHRKEMSDSVKRQVNLLTAICDYFLTVKKSFNYPKVVELKVFEDANHYSKCDSLTGLYNRAYFEEALSGEISRSRRYETEFSVLFLDLDDFKRVNDTMGHLAGDYVLKKVASLINSEKREEDVVVRYGGEELVIVLPETNKINSIIKAERIRKKIQEMPLRFNDKDFKITVSGGIATFPQDAADAQNLVACADQALYRAKSEGKNKICLFSSDKRQYVRIDFAGDIKVQPLGKWVGQGQVFAKSKDLSLSGILFESKDPMEIGAKVQLEVPLPTQDNPIILVGVVVRVEIFEAHYEIGVSFVQLQGADRRELSSFLKIFPSEP
ncbi:MAG: diguanylate cyclase [Nitrospinaceae bacterium]|nr:diguanylate cyclase [Nitrospinaceae bacterium]NIR53907.1 diguanylate cyclase [Nitrospinaceae bacterium]NIS84321.1 diguanylate cyclase [Nitrospinaceae bacterium]NIT81128.1 diguanylate cyclase [Nitrospinaceae bacterium]NIU43410.1 diguanylate cyclase [Nitrospinaceae bacterium]